MKAVIDAYEELVDEGCLLVFGPSITDNVEPTKVAIEERFRVPTISVTGSEEWLGKWTFSLSMGSMSDEPISWSDLIAKRGLTDVGVLIEVEAVVHCGFGCRACRLCHAGAGVGPAAVHGDGVPERVAE